MAKARVVARLRSKLARREPMTKEEREGLRVGLCGGVFRILHPGHVLFLEWAKAQCDILVVVVARDALAKQKGFVPFSAEFRAKMVESVKAVDLAVVGWEDPQALVDIINPDVVILGYDQGLPCSLPKGTAVVRAPAFSPQLFKTSRLMKNGDSMVELEVVEVSLPENVNMIAGTSHFIKTVEDLYEVLAESGIKGSFAVAFCEASGKRLIRYDGNDGVLIKHAVDIAERIGAGHFFVILLKDVFPINVLNRVKMVSEVVQLFCATANPCKFVVASEGEQRAVLGVMDGFRPLGVEGEGDKEERRAFLRKIGYKR